MMVGKRVGVLGALNVDIVIHGTAPADLEELKSFVGPSEIGCLAAGSVGYFSQNFVKLGYEVNLVSAVADDPFGRSIIASLQDADIATDQISVEPRALSGVGVYILLFGAPKRPMIYQLPTHDAWPRHLKKNAVEYLLDSKLIHCGGYLHFPNLWNNEVPNLFERARKNGVITSLDPQFPLSHMESPWMKVLKPLLDVTDVLLLDESEALGVSGARTLKQAVTILLGIGVGEVVIKRGEKGCLVLSNGEEFDQPALQPSKIIDSIGAGDSFDVGYLYGKLEGFLPAKAAKLATYAASKSIEGSGGTNAFPVLKEIQRFEEEN